MEGKMMQKYAKIGGLVGLVLVFAGLLVYAINTMFTLLSTIPLILGGLLIVAYIILDFQSIKEGLSSRSAKFGSNAALMILVVLGLLVVVNMLLSRFNARIDTTAAKQFSLAEQTRKVLKNLDADTKALGFFKTNEEGRAEELFDEYTEYSDRFSYEIIDPDKKPGIAKQYDIQQYGTVVFESEGKQEKVTETSEENFTNALIAVSREEVKKIYFSTGHGEHSPDTEQREGMSFAKEMLEDENYVLESIMLAGMAADSLPQDMSLLVIAGPRSDLFPNETEMIKNYLKGGGKLLLMLDPDSPQSYVDLAADYGVTVRNDMVIDASGIGQLFGAGPIMPLVNTYTDHAITKDFNVMTLFNEARSLTKSDNVPTGLTVSEIAKTNPRSWGETSPISGEGVAFDEGQDIRGPLTLLAVGEKDAEDQSQAEDKFDLGDVTVKTRFAIYGDSDFATNGFIRNQGNGDLFMNTVSWLAEQEDLISVRPRDPEDRRLSLTQQQAKMIFYLGVLLLPVLIFATGVWVYVKRK
jgi:ABC-type uncharacterized transport system involved in gliding motility auxiliary subunit